MVFRLIWTFLFVFVSLTLFMLLPYIWKTGFQTNGWKINELGHPTQCHSSLFNIFKVTENTFFLLMRSKWIYQSFSCTHLNGSTTYSSFYWISMTASPLFSLVYRSISATRKKWKFQGNWWIIVSFLLVFEKKLYFSLEKLFHYKNINTEF